MKTLTSLILLIASLLNASGVSGLSSTVSTPARQGTKYVDLDDNAAASTAPAFPIASQELIALAKKVVYEKRIGLNDNGDCLADNFTFRAQFVEVDKKGMLSALNSFNLEDSFDMIQYFYGWMTDPMQPGRVWFMNRVEAKHVNKFMGVKPDGKELVLPPQLFHMDFDPATKKVTEFGFYTVDRAQGNTGGLGGAFAYFYGVGRPLPFPEAKPYKKSFRRRLVEGLGALATKFQKKNKN